MYRLFIAETEIDFDIECARRPSFQYAEVPGLRMIMQEMATPYRQLPFLDRLAYALSLTTHLQDVETFLLALGVSSLTEEIVQAVDREKGNILRFTVDALASAYGEKDEQRTLSWSTLLKEVIRLKGHMHQCDGNKQGSSPMMAFLRSATLCYAHYKEPRQTYVHSAVRFGVQELLSAGVDLMAYGKVETNVWDELPEFDALQIRHGRQMFRLDCFTYGAQPEDWTVSVRRCGQVWKRKTKLPGSWQHDDPELERRTTRSHQEYDWSDWHEWEFDRWFDISRDESDDE